MSPMHALTSLSARRGINRGSNRHNSCRRVMGIHSMFGLSIRTLLMGFFAIMVAVVAGLGAFALVNIADVNASTADIATNWMPSVSNLRALEYQAARFRTDEARHVMSTADAAMDAVERDIAQRLAGIEKIRRAYEPRISSSEEKAGYEAFARDWDAYMKIHAALLKKSRQSKRRGGKAVPGGRRNGLQRGRSRSRQAGRPQHAGRRRCDQDRCRKLWHGVARDFGVHCHRSGDRDRRHGVRARRGCASASRSRGCHEAAGRRRFLGEAAGP